MLACFLVPTCIVMSCCFFQLMGALWKKRLPDIFPKHNGLLMSMGSTQSRQNRTLLHLNAPSLLYVEILQTASWPYKHNTKWLLICNTTMGDHPVLKQITSFVYFVPLLLLHSIQLHTIKRLLLLKYNNNHHHLCENIWCKSCCSCSH